jgi:hypothetical protein
MKEHPILFADEMVRAILDGRKTQTRRLAKPTADGMFDLYCPWTVGDRLWVRECWATIPQYGPYSTASVSYRADNGHQYVEFEHISTWAQLSAEKNGQRWRPSIHMPRWASRITLEITGLRLEKLQAISEADAIAEGLSPHTMRIGGACTARHKFSELWESIYGKRLHCDWLANPYVWVIQFERVT